MGIQINGNTDNISATDGGLTVNDLELNQTGVSTFHSHLHVADQIIHLDDANSKIRFPAADTITAETSGSERVRIDSSGRVMIGNTDAGSLYASGNNLVVGSGGASNQGITIYTGNAQQGILAFADGTSGGAQQYAGYMIYDHNTNNMLFATQATERLRIDANGMIGIGGVTPKTQNTFDAIEFGKTGFLGSQTGARTVEMVSNAYYNSGWKYKEADVATQYYQYNGYHAFTTAASGSADGAITFTERLRITSAGKVNIGDNQMSSNLLNIEDGTAAAIDIASHGTGGDTAYIGVKKSSGGGLTFGISNRDIIFKTGASYSSGTTFDSGTERVRIKSDGNVDIGGGTHSRNLTVHAATNSVILIEGASNGTSNLMFGDENDEDVGMLGYNHASNYLAFTVNTGERLRITSGGKINIGDTDLTQTTDQFCVSIAAQNAVDNVARFQSAAAASGTSESLVKIYKGAGYGGVISGYITQGSDHGLKFYTASNASLTERLRINSNGVSTFNANITMNNHPIRRNQHHWGHLEGSYNNIGANDTKSNPIYTIGSNYNPTDAALSNMYGIGYSHGNANFTPSGAGWGMYVASDGNSRIYLDGSNGRIYYDTSGRYLSDPTGDYGSVQVNHNGKNGWEGFSIDGRVNFMHDGSNSCGIYNDVDNEWFIQSIRNSNTYLYFNGSESMRTTGEGILVSRDIRWSGTGAWTGEATNGKIQIYSGHMYIQNGGTTTVWVFRNNAGTEKAQVLANGNYNPLSDVSVKKDITTVNGALDIVKQLTGRTFTFKDDNSKSAGVIAQELEPIIPDLVNSLPSTDINGGVALKTVNYTGLNAYYIEAIKELSAKVEALETKVATLEGS